MCTQKIPWAGVFGEALKAERAVEAIGDRERSLEEGGGGGASL